jgi:nickel superoxide dismutase
MPTGDLTRACHLWYITRPVTPKVHLRGGLSVKKILILSAAVAMLAAAAQPVLSHCEVPCGIYDDEMRIQMIHEHITTIEKAMKQITALSAESPVNFNQLVRWTTNKEKHAEELQHIVQQYFMTQRIKPAHAEDGSPDQGYVDKLTTLHMIVVHAMKAKQSTDLEQIGHLRGLTDKFNKLYFAGK